MKKKVEILESKIEVFAIKKLKSGKVVGMAGILSEVQKASSSTMVKVMKEIIGKLQKIGWHLIYLFAQSTQSTKNALSTVPLVL